jgi:predicted Zn-dependent protease
MKLHQAIAVLSALLMLTVVGCTITPVCQIYFVPIGTFPDTMTQNLIRHYDQTLKLRIRPLPALPVTDDMVDPIRKQLIGEEVIRKMKEQWPPLATDPNVKLFGITGEDMFIRSKQWYFAFALREEGRFALVSTHRMDHAFFKLPPNEDVMGTRLRKMLTKQIGLHYYGLPDRKEKTSVLFSPILGLDDLDAVASEFDTVDRERLAQLPRPCPMPSQPIKPVP